MDGPQLGVDLVDETSSFVEHGAFFTVVLPASHFSDSSLGILSFQPSPLMESCTLQLKITLIQPRNSTVLLMDFWMS